MSGGDQPTVWKRWIRQPQRIWLRRALFQVHLWSGIAVGLYILMISVTGSVLVYWNELYRAATPEPIISRASEPRLTDGQLADYRPWFDNHRRLRQLIAELEALSLAIAEADHRWNR